MNSKWFGREPSLVINGIGAVLTLLVVFGLPGWNDALVAAITAALTAGAAWWTAWHVRPWPPSLFSGIVGAGFTLLASFGLHFSQAQTGAVTLAVAGLMAILTRAQQTPIASPAPAVAARE